MHKKFEINRIKIKGGCQSGRKVVPHDSKSDLPLSGIHEEKHNFSSFKIQIRLKSYEKRCFYKLL